MSLYKTAGWQTEAPAPLLRRRFLAGGAAATVWAAIPRRALAQTSLTPDAALEELLAGNRRFTSGHPTAFDEDLAILKHHTAEKQEPFAAVLSCADSRVPVEMVFDQSIGHIFVTRVAGNVVTPEIMASLEYGAIELGVRTILVMGHSNCGAVKATMKCLEVPGQISALYQHIQPAVNQAGSDLEAAIQINATLQSALLREASTVISGMVRANKLKVAAAYYDIASGHVSLLPLTSTP
jgi:carbonic anhydrase